MNFNPKALLAIGILSVAGIGSMAQAQDIKPVSFQQASTIAQLASAIGAQPGAIKNAPVEGVAFKINASGVECLVNAKDAPDLNTLYQQNNNVARCMVGLIGQQDIADSVKELAQSQGAQAPQLMEKALSQAMNDVGGPADHMLKGVGMFLTAVAAGNDPSLGDWAKQVAQQEQDPGTKAVLERVSGFIQTKASLGSAVEFKSFKYVLNDITEIAINHAPAPMSIQDTQAYR